MIKENLDGINKHPSPLEVEEAVSEMHDRIARKELLKRCIEINRLETSEIGFIGRRWLTSLMAQPIRRSYRGEIYDHLEIVIDRCEGIANNMVRVAMKSS